MSLGEQGREITFSTEAYWSPMRLYAWWTCRALVTEDIATVTAWTIIICLTPFSLCSYYDSAEVAARLT